MKSKYKAAILGCGNIAGLNEFDAYREKPCTHAGAYKSRQDIELIGCCDSSEKRAKEFAEKLAIPFYTTDYRELLALEVDILSICIPYKYHWPVISKVLSGSKNPKIIFLEKPISDNLNHAKKIIKLCKSKKIKLYVNNRRPSLFYKQLKEFVQKEFNNEIISISAWCSSGMHAIGIHMVDLLRYIAGEVDWVFSTQEKLKVESLPYSSNFHSQDPRYSSLIGFKNGIVANLFNSARTDYTYFEIEILCIKGRVRACDNGKKLIYQVMAKPGTSTLSYRLDQEKEIGFSKKPLFKLLIGEIIEGDYVNSPIKSEEALKTYSIIAAMKQSSQTKKVQYVK